MKISAKIHQADLKGLLALQAYCKTEKNYVVSNVARPRVEDIDGCKIEVLPHAEFLKRLWQSDIIDG